MKDINKKDINKKDKGKYIETFTKEKDNITYIKIETTIVGREFEIMNFQIEYQPGLVYPQSWKDI